MRLRTRNSSKGAIEVPAFQNILSCLVLIDATKPIQQGETWNPTVGKPGINLSPDIAREATIILLSLADVLDHLIDFDDSIDGKI